jgi:Reverse transcriptase (RNA-dependent DNA polymerase)
MRKMGTPYWETPPFLLNQINEYVTFIDKGHHSKVRTSPAGFKRTRVHIVYDIKHDGRHKARLVADGHLTAIPLDSVYSGVVSLQGFRLVLFLAELNELQLWRWATDIGNAYLEAYTSKKVYIIAGPKFGDREGHILVISKAL